MQEVSIPNPALKPFSILIGIWNTTGTHGLVPDTTLQGRTSEEKYHMLTFDERGVSRKYEVTLRDNTWKWWRNAPGFFQRYEGRIGDDGNTIIGKGELSKDDLSWEKDLDLTHRRAEHTESRNM